VTKLIDEFRSSAGRRSAANPPPLVTPPGVHARYAALDGLRFVAAVAVVAFHYLARTTDIWPQQVATTSPAIFRLAKFGFYGVDLFFIISGFVILMSAWQKPLHTFVASRISRLYPAYWAGVILTGVLLLVTSHPKVTVGQIVVNLTMFQEAFGVGRVDGVYWTLWVEMRFYLLIGIFLLVGMTTTRVLAFAAIWPIIGILTQSTHADFLYSLLIVKWAALFAGGMVLYVIARNGPTLISLLILGADIVFSGPTASADAATAILKDTGAGISSASQWIAIVLCFALVAAVTLSPLRHLSWKWMTFAGALTYPLYLLHEEIGYAVIRLADPVTGQVVALILAFLVSLGLALAVNLLVERPFARRLRNRLVSELERYRKA
jgi:peptidoglycan/LPS O-acetylase OafA/YrhL